MSHCWNWVCLKILFIYAGLLRRKFKSCWAYALFKAVIDGKPVDFLQIRIPLWASLFKWAISLLPYKDLQSWLQYKRRDKSRLDYGSFNYSNQHCTYNWILEQTWHMVFFIQHWFVTKHANTLYQLRKKRDNKIKISYFEFLKCFNILYVKEVTEF